jgi:hypothetical protein
VRLIEFWNSLQYNTHIYCIIRISLHVITPRTSGTHRFVRMLEEIAEKNKKSGAKSRGCLTLFWGFGMLVQ